MSAEQNDLGIASDQGGHFQILCFCISCRGVSPDQEIGDLMAEQEVRDMDLLQDGHDMVTLKIFFCKRKSQACYSVPVIA